MGNEPSGLKRRRPGSVRPIDHSHGIKAPNSEQHPVMASSNGGRRDDDKEAVADQLERGRDGVTPTAAGKGGNGAATKQADKEKESADGLWVLPENARKRRIEDDYDIPEKEMGRGSSPRLVF